MIPMEYHLEEKQKLCLETMDFNLHSLYFEAFFCPGRYWISAFERIDICKEVAKKY